MTHGLWPENLACLTGVQRRPAGVIFAVEGTAYPGAPEAPVPLIDDGSGWWAGFSSGMVGGLINAQDGLWDSVCVPYPAATIPMWPSVQQGRQALKTAMAQYAAGYLRKYGSYDGLAILMTGYSQGSMVVDEVYTKDLLSPGGGLHFLLPCVYRIYQFGHVFRTPGIANGNELAGLPQSIPQDGVETGGIGLGLDLLPAQTNYVARDGRPVVHSCANPGDLYAACSVGTDPWSHPAPEGKVGNIFMNIVMQPTFADVLSTVTVLGELLPAVLELFHTMSFFAQGMNSPHYQYYAQMDACVADALALGNSLPHA